jgi:hypothetical protein
MQPDLHREGFCIFVRCCDLTPETAVGDFVSTIEDLDRIFLEIGKTAGFFPNPYGGAIYCLRLPRLTSSGSGASGSASAWRARSSASLRSVVLLPEPGAPRTPPF